MTPGLLFSEEGALGLGRAVISASQLHLLQCR